MKTLFLKAKNITPVEIAMFALAAVAIVGVVIFWYNAIVHGMHGTI